MYHYYSKSIFMFQSSWGYRAVILDSILIVKLGKQICYKQSCCFFTLSSNLLSESIIYLNFNLFLHSIFCSRFKFYVLYQKMSPLGHRPLWPEQLDQSLAATSIALQDQRFDHVH